MGEAEIIYYTLAFHFFRAFLWVVGALGYAAGVLSSLVLRLNRWAETRIDRLEKETRKF